MHVFIRSVKLDYSSHISILSFIAINMQNYINALIFTKNKSEEMLTFSLHSAIVVNELDRLTEGHRLGAGED